MPKTCPTCSKVWPDDAQFCGDDRTRLNEPDDILGLVGQTVGQHEVIRVLGRGGMGTVYLGKHVNLHRLRAIKVLNPSVTAHADALARFEREGRNAATVPAHPNVCQVYDLGYTAEGLAFLIMEYIEGPSLSELLESEGGMLQPERAGRITEMVAAGLEAVHANGIVHRDLKPGNIMLSADQTGRELAKIVDFGISKLAADFVSTSPPGLEGQAVTQVGLVAGTPDYMSPEHLTGHEPTPLSDVYSLGVVLFRMLTGRVPSARDGVGADTRSLASARPSARFPPALDRAVQRALSVNRSERFPSATAFASAVTNALSGNGSEPSASQPGSFPNRAHDRDTLRRYLLSGAAAAVAFVVVWLGWPLIRGTSGTAGLSVEPASLSLASGSSETLSLTATDGTELDPADLTFWTSDSTRAHVYRGQVSAAKAGKATVGITNGSDTVAVAVTVTPGDPATLKLSPGELALGVEDDGRFEARLKDRHDNDVDDAALEWSVDPTSVATVDQDGTVHAVRAGDAAVRVVVEGASDPLLTAEAKLVVRSGTVAPVLTQVEADRELLRLYDQVSELRTRESQGSLDSELSSIRADAGRARIRAQTLFGFEHLDRVSRGAAAYITSIAFDVLGRPDDASRWNERAEQRGGPQTIVELYNRRP